MALFVVPFIPLWLTPSGPVGQATEDQNFLKRLGAVRSGTFSGFSVTKNDDGEWAVAIGQTTVATVFRNAVPYSGWTQRSDGSLVLSNVKPADLFEVRTADQIKFERLNGDFPVGIEMSDFGEIVGIPDNLPSATIGVAQSFGFTARITDGVEFRDRYFTMTVLPTTGGFNNPEWIEPEPANGVQSLGSYRRGAPFSVMLQTTRPDNVSGILDLVPLEDVQNVDEDFQRLPPGLSMSPNGLITGVVATQAKVGIYYVTIRLRNARGEDLGLEARRNFSITITSPSGVLEPLKFVRWVTPAGSLGQFYEGQSSPVGVRAFSTTGEAVFYTVLAETPLPRGLTLNHETGDIQGVFSHITADADILFSVRAQVGQTFVDRTFSIRLVTRYSVAGTTTVSFKLRRSEALAMAADYEAIISQDDYFRPNDPNFGKVDDLLIYLIGGLGEPVDVVNIAVRGSEVRGPVSLRLGQHKLAFAKVGNTVVYEVVYREVIDPLHRAGGYKLVGGVPVKEPLRYPQSNPSAPRYIFPESINNIRYEFVTKVGFAAFNPAQNRIPGLGGPENLPLWMTSPQIGVQPSTAIGFIPAVAVAYVKPGKGQTILDKLSVRRLDAPQALDLPNPLATGHEVSFDQFYMAFETLADATTFDINYNTDGEVVAPFETTFDEKLTTFDSYAFQQGKYHRITPKTGGNS